MVRPIGILVGLGIVTAVLWSLLWGLVSFIQSPPVMSAEHYVQHHLQPKKEISFSFDGPFGTYNNQQLQRGFQVYKEVCAACHSLKLVAFRDLEGIGFSKPEVKAIAKGWAIETPTLNPDTGEASTRKSIASDRFPLPFANDIAARAANNNAIPPDQSLLAKARDEGPHYIYRLLTGYSAQPAELLKKYPDVKTPPGLHYNAYFPNLNLAMAPPLTGDGQVSYSDGTKATVPQMAEDVSAFLMWTAEPKLEQRHRVGWAAFIFLFVFTCLTYMAYKSIWADKKNKVATDVPNPER